MMARINTLNAKVIRNKQFYLPVQVCIYQIYMRYIQMINIPLL